MLGVYLRRYAFLRYTRSIEYIPKGSSRANWGYRQFALLLYIKHLFILVVITSQIVPLMAIISLYMFSSSTLKYGDRKVMSVLMLHKHCGMCQGTRMKK